MKNVSMTIILVSVLTLTLVSTAIFSGFQQVRAEDDENEKEEENQQINKCENNSKSEDSDLECNNIVVYGVVCLPGAQCVLDSFEVPFELVTPF
ncbi:MAG TPA: hypothetical protein VF248_05825 [Nitrososphaeraceae archaeon]|nr:hypothetical protein [Nitrososphaeraceae archaeon]